jgi:hypothetical protein
VDRYRGSERECPELRRDEDAYGMGEGALQCLLTTALALGLVGTAHGSVMCRVSGTHDLHAFPGGPLSGKLHAGTVRVTELGFDCKGREWAHVGRGWIDRKYLMNCDTSDLHMQPFCE